MGAHYHSIDKALDLYYLGLEAWVSLSWVKRVPRILSLGLFAFRVVGVVAFEVTNWRPLLFVFPNLFENWFLFVLVRCRFFPGVRLDTWPRIALWLLVLYAPKLLQEYVLHVRRAQPWNWFKETVLGE